MSWKKNLEEEEQHYAMAELNDHILGSTTHVSF